MDEKKLENNGEKISNETAHEIMAAFAERNVKRWQLMCIIIFIAFVLSNAFWIWRDSQYIDEANTVTQDIDTGTGDAVITGVGDINYGEDQTNSNN